MASRKIQPAPRVTIEDARLTWRNFTGRKGRFNEEGIRSFGVEIPNPVARQMKLDGWNIKQLKQMEEGDPETFAVNVELRFDNRPPKVFMITPTTRVRLTEDMLEILDWADIVTADVIIRGHIWDEAPRIKAYLQTLVVTINEDDLDRKYSLNSE